MMRFYDQHPAAAQLYSEVIQGLRGEPKSIPPKFFYDERGSFLFGEICRLPEYYLTRVEMSILRECAASLVYLIPPRHVIIELGSGGSDKVRILLQALRPVAYVPIDIAQGPLLTSTERLKADFPEMELHAICADYAKDVVVPSSVPAAPRLVFFPGSTLGNFEPAEAEIFLRRLRALVREDGGLLIGIDLKKDRRVLHAAYNDAQGVTAAFNLNLLARVQNELGAEVALEWFRHEAFYNEAAGRVEMHLVSRREQEIVINGDRFSFEEGDGIRTEYSYKYTVEEFHALAARAGYYCEQLWLDARKLFSVHYLRLAPCAGHGVTGPS